MNKETKEGWEERFEIGMLKMNGEHFHFLEKEFEKVIQSCKSLIHLEIQETEQRVAREEGLIKQLPFVFQVYHKSKCNCCEIMKEEAVNYELKIEVRRNFDVNEREHKTFLIYYKPKFHSSFSKPPLVIGKDNGMGNENLQDLVEELRRNIKHHYNITE